MDGSCRHLHCLQQLGAEGSLDTAAAIDTEKALKPLYDVEGKDIILDCSNMSYISSAGLRLFLAILQDAQGKGGHVYIKGINDNVRTVFTITGFSNIFEFKFLPVCYVKHNKPPLF